MSGQLPAQGSRQPTQQIAQRIFPRADFERAYVSLDGEYLRSDISTEGNLFFVDTEGSLTLLRRNYASPVEEDYRGRLVGIGDAPIRYDYRVRVEQVGNTAIDYDYRGRLSSLNSDTITYDARGHVSQIGTVGFEYDRGILEAITDNYTSNGIRVFIVE